MVREYFGVRVVGVGLDENCQCAHYYSVLDVVANRFGCCGEYYACHLCHEALAGHPAKPWPVSRFSEAACLCGMCGRQMTAKEYFDCGDMCPGCGAAFNPGCKEHRGQYFELDQA